MALDKDVESWLLKAGMCGAVGEAGPMESYIAEAQTSAMKTGQDISEELAGIKRVGYSNAVPIQLANAREFAETRPDSTEEALKLLTLMDASLSLAVMYNALALKYNAGQPEQDIISQVEEIQKLYYPNLRRTLPK
ncbi:MAG: hypothetical protein V1702_04650 [Candidatus Woesearchaeota archaeon]